MTREAALAVTLAACLIVPSLGLRDSWVPDETRYADVAQGMLEGRGWITPSLAGEAYTEKPPFFFWMTAALASAGVPIDAAPRAVSMAAGLGTIALVPMIGSALGIAAPAAGRAALILATTPFFLIYAQMGLLDAWLTFLVTLSIAAKLTRARAGAPGRAVLALLEGAALGAALLTKGPVALLFPLGLRLGGLLSGRPAAARPDRTDALALGVAAAFAFAWLGLAWRQSGGEYLTSLTIGQLETRLGGGPDTPHSRPPGFLLVAMIVALLPWTPFGMSALRHLRHLARLFEREAVGPLLGWFALPIALLATIPSQQAHYALPALPAAALLLAPATLRAETSAVRRSLAALACVLGLALIAISIAGPIWIPAGDSVSLALELLFGDVWFRSIGVATGGALLALGLIPSQPRIQGGTSPRVAVAGALVFCAALLVAWRAAPLLIPRALLADPEIQHAARIMAPSTLRSAVRLWTPHRDILRSNDTWVVEQLRHEPGVVVLIWERDFRWLAARDPVKTADLEEIGSGFTRGYRVIAVRGPASTRPSGRPPIQGSRRTRGGSQTKKKW